MKIKTKYLVNCILMLVGAFAAFYVRMWKAGLFFLGLAVLFGFMFWRYRDSTEYDTFGTINNVRKDLKKKAKKNKNEDDWEKRQMEDFIASVKNEDDDFDYGIDDDED
jgi:membrane protein implicated in regulation of membrane protease activity